MKIPHEKNNTFIRLESGIYNFKFKVFINNELYLNKTSFYDYIFGFKYKVHYHGHDFVIKGYPTRKGFQYSFISSCVNNQF